MHLNLGSIVKGVTTGLETLAETGNPYIAAGVGAVACFTDKSGSSATSGSQSASVQTFNPLLDQMSADLNSGGTSHMYSYAKIAGLDSGGNAVHRDPYGGVNVADLVS